jgi:hypothetical protein
MSKVLVIDTSMLCAKLNVPGKETCGPTDDPWNQERVNQVLHVEAQQGTTFVLPLAAIIETGNHIAQAPERRYEIAKTFAEIIDASADEQSPWAAFARQVDLWSAAELHELAAAFPEAASHQRSMGDMTIAKVADFYYQSGFDVQIFTADEQLRAYQPPQPRSQPQPRRRRKNKDTPL